MLRLSKRLVVNKIRTIYQYLLFIWQRSEEDSIKVAAGHLAYVTLLSVVPLLAVIFFLLSAIPFFSEAKQIFEDLIYNNLVPTSGHAIRMHINEFIENTKKMSMMGMGSLVVIALLLISTIDQTINRIWRCSNKRSKIHAF
ncbi:MAG: YihY family inner membrane protein, partial [Psychromonas sp.]